MGIRRSARAQERTPPPRRSALWRDGRNQHDAVHRRHAGAADHLHGGRAAAGDGRAHRPAADEVRPRSTSTRSPCPSPSTRRARSTSWTSRSSSNSSSKNCRPPPRPAPTSASTCAARAVNYGRVAEVMSLVTSAGFKKVALVTEQERSETGLKFRPTEPGLNISAAAARRAAAGRARRLFRVRRKFDDAQEAIPVEMITDQAVQPDAEGRRETAKHASPRRRPTRSTDVAEVEAEAAAVARGEGGRAPAARRR